jgi:hypothetical protein
MAYIRKIAEGKPLVRNLRRALGHGDKRRPWIGLFIEAMTLRTEEQSRDQVLRPDRRLRRVRPYGFRHAEPSRPDRRLIGLA